MTDLGIHRDMGVQIHTPTVAERRFGVKGLRLGTVPNSLLLKEQGGQGQKDADPSGRDKGVNGGELGLHFLIQVIEPIFDRLKAGFQTLEQGVMLLDAAFQVGDSFRQGVNGHMASVT